MRTCNVLPDFCFSSCPSMKLFEGRKLDLSFIDLYLDSKPYLNTP